MANTTNIDLVKPAGTDHALISALNSNFDKIDAEAGRLRNNFAGTYSTTSGYAVGDYCIYQGNLYSCTTAIGSSGENWTAAHWTQTKAGTELKGLSDQIENKANTIKLYSVALEPTGNVPAWSNKECRKSISSFIDAGYKILMLTPGYSGDNQFVWTSLGWDSNDVYATIRNASDATDSGTPSISVLAIKE